MPTSHLTHPKYRADIDGLRAIAILSVVIFHAFPTALTGGFVGVDIFFVISGFLISTIIFNNLERKSFSFIEFYSRRIRRIFPALLTVLIASYAFGWFALFTNEYRAFGKHMVGGIGSIANILLWQESGYFDAAAETKPLLHLWSLGIEEQFYIVWPLLIWAVWKRGYNALSLIIVLAILSFALNVQATHANPSMGFYFPHTRAWELFIGACLAYLSLHMPAWLTNLGATLDRTLESILYIKHSAKRQTLRNLEAWVGLGCIIFAVVTIKKGFLFPGWWALLPTMGTALLIHAGMNAWLNRNILANRVLVWFGLISFPLYLWHWPLLSFARITLGETPSATTRLALLLASILLAWLTYRYIEKPIRFGKHLRRNALWLCVAASLIAALGLATYLSNGIAFRGIARANSFNVDQLALRNDAPTPGCRELVGYPVTFCKLYGNRDHITTALIGDSTANALSSGLAKVYATDRGGLINLGAYGCWPVHGALGPPKEPCIQAVNKSYEFLLNQPSIKTVIFSFVSGDLPPLEGIGDTSKTTIPERLERMKPYFSRDIEMLKKAGKTVIVSFDPPSTLSDPASCLDRHLFFTERKTCVFDESVIVNRQPFIDYYERYFQSRGDVCVFHQYDLFAKPNHQFSMVDRNHQLLRRDNVHLSIYGSEQMAELFKKSKCYKPH